MEEILIRQIALPFLLKKKNSTLLKMVLRGPTHDGRELREPESKKGKHERERERGGREGGRDRGREGRREGEIAFLAFNFIGNSPTRKLALG